MRDFSDNIFIHIYNEVLNSTIQGLMCYNNNTLVFSVFPADKIAIRYAIYSKLTLCQRQTTQGIT